MGEDTQSPDQAAQTVDQQPRHGLPSGLDPRRALDSTSIEVVMRAQAAARAQAHAATTVTLATIVSLVTSAFAFVAAFAWNNAIQQMFDENAFRSFFGHTIDKGLEKFVFAVFVTIIAVVVIVVLNRIARRLAVKSALEPAGK
jgi:hypothetical protein